MDAEPLDCDSSVAVQGPKKVAAESAGVTFCEHSPTAESQRKANQMGLTIFFRKWNRPFFFAGVAVPDWSSGPGFALLSPAFELLSLLGAFTLFSGAFELLSLPGGFALLS